jgi:riboflavin kinase / FMN adenylyltransferase
LTLWPLPSPAGAPSGDALSDLTAPWPHGAVVALGNFDGVHVGHRTLLAHAAGQARALAAPLVAITFFPPAKVVFAGAKFLSSAAEKGDLLRSAGSDEVVTIGFDPTFAATPAEEFVAAIAQRSPRLCVVGEDFRFGRDRRGGVETLHAALAEVAVVPLALAGGRVAKSSEIRAALAEADVASAGAMLGGPYRVRGVVIRGDQRGRTIGFPTANVATDPRKALPVGVFAVAVDTPFGRRAGMANVGPRPTFPDGAPALEVHLFDFDDDLYDQEITVHLLAHLRAPRPFGSLAELKRALGDDALAARAVAAAWGLR